MKIHEPRVLLKAVFKIKSPFFCCPIFFKNYINLLVSINKIVTGVNYYLSPSGLPSRIHALHKKRSFPLGISPVNVTKSADSCEFGHIYCTNF